MKRVIHIFIIAAILLGCKPSTSDSQVPEFSIDKLKGHIAFLASDDLKGRKANEEGYQKASDYVANQLSEKGLKPFFISEDTTGSKAQYFQQVPFVEYSYGENNWMQLSNPPEKIYMNTGYIILNPGTLNGIVEIDSLFFAGIGIHEPNLGWDDFTDADVTERFVLISDGQPQKDDYPELHNLYEKSPASLVRRVNSLKKLNASGLIIVSDIAEKYWEISTIIHRKLGYNPIEPCYMGDPYDPELPVIMINPSLFRKHFPEIPLTINPVEDLAHKTYAVNIELSTEVQSRLFTSPNVAGFIPGTDSTMASEYVILSAHLDHIGSDGDKIFNGANDNASSCAVLLEVASAMVKDPSARSVVFVFYTAEEPCLWGSNHFIRHIPFPNENILVNVNVEMVGKNDKDFRGFTAIGPIKFCSYFGITSPAKVRYRDYGKNKMKFRGSDQFSFYLHDVDAIRFGNLDYPEKHTPKDDISIIDFDHVQDAATTLYKITEDIANTFK